MEKKSLTPAILVLSGCLFSASAQAYVVHFGEDLAGAGTNHAQAAETSFLTSLSGNVYHEDFESFAYGPYNNLALTFDSSFSANLMSGTTNTGVNSARDGRFSVGDESRKYWQAPESLSSFVIRFTQPISAFGFYGIDIGDWGAQLSVRLSNGQVFDLGHSLGESGSTNSSLLYFGLQASSLSETFDSVEFYSTVSDSRTTDYFGFDKMTVALPNGQVSEPAGWALLGLGMLGLGWRSRGGKSGAALTAA